MTRLTPFVPHDLSPDQAELYLRIVEGPRAQGPQHFALTRPDGSLTGPFNALLLAPALGQALQELGAAVRYSTSLTPRIREMAILIVAAKWQSDFETKAHESIGRAAGLSDEELASIREQRLPTLEDAEENACARLAYAMSHGDVDDETWASWAGIIGETRVFELSTLVGYYSTLALQLRVFRVE